MIPILAGIAASLAKEGLGLLGNAVLAKGKEVIEEKIGVNIEDALKTEEGKIKLLEAQTKHEQMLNDFVLAKREQELREVELDNKNTADARSSNAAIATSDHAPWYQKALLPAMAILMALGFFGCFGALLSLSIMNIHLDDNSRDVLIYAFGVLSAGFMAVMNFLFGSSAGSREAQAAVASVAKGRAQ